MRAVIEIRRRPSEYRVASPWVARCNYATCLGRTSYHASQAEALAEATVHTRDHWKVSAA